MMQLHGCVVGRGSVSEEDLSG